MCWQARTTGGAGSIQSGGLLFSNEVSVTVLDVYQYRSQTEWQLSNSFAIGIISFTRSMACSHYSGKNYRVHCVSRGSAFSWTTFPGLALIFPRLGSADVPNGRPFYSESPGPLIGVLY